MTFFVAPGLLGLLDGLSHGIEALLDDLIGGGTNDRRAHGGDESGHVDDFSLPFQPGRPLLVWCEVQGGFDSELVVLPR